LATSVSHSFPTFETSPFTQTASARFLHCCLARYSAASVSVKRILVLVDQFFRIEQGEAKFVFDEKEERPVHAGGAVVVPAGTYHNVVNTSKTAMLKLYTIYSPPNHPYGTVHKTKAEAEAAELVEHR
jgi:mannose-6-phosphate isomerase-like protein (cupin superfamily)